MNGTDATTGKRLAGLEHLRQSVRDILTTPIGSRVMRRDYGSQIFQLVDAPLNRSTIMDFYAAVADALKRWEPRLRLTSVTASQTAPGNVTINLVGEYLPNGQVVTIDGIKVT
jgi:phage baseplate assembly protein W